jgi:hypothetical protein
MFAHEDVGIPAISDIRGVDCLVTIGASLMARTSLTALAACALLAVTAAPALAGPNEDYTGVKRNWVANQTSFVTPCRFSEGQLFNAVMVSQFIGDDNYTSFRNAVVDEYKRVKAGGCIPLRPGVFAPRGSRIRITASPAKIVQGKSKRFTFAVTTIVDGKSQAIQGASVAFGGTTLKTDKGGRARITKSFSKPGRQRANATLAGLKAGKANVDVTRAPKKAKKPKKK